MSSDFDSQRSHDSNANNKKVFWGPRQIGVGLLGIIFLFVLWCTRSFGWLGTYWGVDKEYWVGAASSLIGTLFSAAVAIHILKKQSRDQATAAQIDRENQANEAEIQRLHQAEEAKKERDYQAELARLDRDISATGQLQRTLDAYINFVERLQTEQKEPISHKDPRLDPSRAELKTALTRWKMNCGLGPFTPGEVEDVIWEALDCYIEENQKSEASLNIEFRYFLEHFMDSLVDATPSKPEVKEEDIRINLEYFREDLT